MKKIVITCCFIILMVSLLAITSNAATNTTTYETFNRDLHTDQTDVWFCDVVYNGQIVGYGYFNYDAGTQFIFQISSAEIETEYQNFSLPRTLGVNNGIDIKAYAYMCGNSGYTSSSYSWSDNNYRGGNSSGWISTVTSIDDTYATNANGYVRITTSSGRDTYYFLLNDTN